MKMYKFYYHLFPFFLIIFLVIQISTATKCLNRFSYQNLFSLENEERNSSDLQNLLSNIVKTFKHEFVDETTEKQYDECISSLVNVTKTYPNLFSQIFRYSGKELSDFGKLEECTSGLIKNVSNGTTTFTYYGNLTYYFMIFEINGSSLFSREKDQILVDFLNKTSYYTGICLIEHCKNFFNDFFNRDINKGIAELYQDKINFSEVYSSNGVEFNHNNYKLFATVLIISFIYLGIKGLLTLFRIFCYSHGYQQASIAIQKKLIDEQAYSDKESTYEKRISMKEIHNNNSIFNIGSNRSYEYGYEYYPIKMRIIKFFDFFDNFYTVLASKHLYINDDGIEPLNFMRFIVMLFLILYQTFYCLYFLPSGGLINYDFFTSNYFFLIKLSIYSSVFWINIDAAATTNKLMMLIRTDLKKRNSNKISVQVLLKFFIYSIPKIITFILVLYFWEYYFIQFFNFSDYKYPLGKYFEEKFLKKKECYNIQKFYEIFIIPFIHRYSNSFDNCFKHASIYVSIFYCFILLLFYIYVVYRIRNSKLDNIVIIVFTVLTFLSFLVRLKQDKPEKYVLEYVLGENLSEKRLPLIIIYYFYGVFIGMCYFYYNDVTSKDSMTRENTSYFPFSLCFYIVKKLDTINRIFKYILFYVFLFIIFLISFSFTLMIHNNGNNILIENFGHHYVNFIYEKQYNSIFFCCLLLLLLVYPKDSFLRNLSDSTFFQIFGRVSFSFYSLAEITTYYVYFFIISAQLNVNYQTLIMLSIGNFIFVYIFALLLTLLYEMPIKLIIKRLLGNEISLRDTVNNDGKSTDRSSIMANEMQLINHF